MAKSEKNTKKSIVIPSNAEERKKALDAAVAHIEKAYGKGAIMKLGEKRHVDVDVIPTGSLTLDMALGIGGVPRGRVVEIYGPESSGKTTVALHIVAQAQKNGGNAAYIDVEHALDPVYAKALGVDIDNLLISQPDSGEQALEIAEALTRSAAIDVLVIDSVAAMVTKAEIDGLMGDNHVGQLARLMSAAMRKLTSVIARSNCVAIFINQIREKIGIAYGNPETTPGGRALKFYSSVRIEVRKSTAIKDGGEIIGNLTNCKVVKNKVAPPFRTCSFDIMYGKGISRTGEVLDLAVDYEVVKKGGAWFSFNGEKLGQGRDNVKELFEQKPEIYKEVEEKLKEAIAKEEQDIAEGKKVTPKKSTTSKKAKAAAKKAALENGDIDADFDDTAVIEPDEAIEPTNDGADFDIGDDDEDENFEEFTPISTDK